MVFDPDSLELDDSFEDWDSDLDAAEAERDSGWRRWVVGVIAVVVVISLLLVSLSNLVRQGAPPVADNGLAVCGFDYCLVQEAIRAVGLDLEMSRLANTILDDAETRLLADDLASFLGIEPVDISLVDQLEGRLGGFYDPGSRAVVIERPANAWVVSHEVAHSVASGHGIDFQKTLAALVRYVGTSR